MPQNPYFTRQLPINSSRAKRSYLGCVLLICLGIAGYTMAQIFGDQFAFGTYSWTVKLHNWSVFMGISTLIFTPFIYFMQDRRNPSLAISDQGLFINHQMMRNTIIPFSNIEKVEKTDQGYKLLFKDQAAVLQKLGIYKGFVKYNIENDRFFISNMYISGDLDTFFNELKKHLLH